MRKLLGLVLLPALVAGCSKSGQQQIPFYTSTFTATINGGNLWTWAFTNQTDDPLSFTQTWNSGAAGKQTHWHLSMSDPTLVGSLSFAFPGIDSSTTLPTGKPMSFTSRINTTSANDINASYGFKGSFFLGTDSTFLTINFSSFAQGKVTGTFTMQLYNNGTIVNITDGHFTNVPITLTGQ